MAQDFQEIYLTFTDEESCTPKEYTRFYNHCTSEIRWKLQGFGLQVHAENGADVDELLGELAVRIQENIAQFDLARGTFKNWVNGIVYNLVVDFIRRINAQKHPPIKHVDDETFTRLCEDIRDSHQPELDYIEKEQMKELFELINQHLNSYQYHVLNYTVQGYQPSDIAKRLRKTPDQISKTLYRIRRKLRSILESKN